MSALAPWDDLIAGKNCPFCAARPDRNEFSVKVVDLSISTLYLNFEQTYRGYCVLVFKERHVTGLEHLTAEEHAAFAADLKRAADAIYKATGADHMNYATLGNVIPHLHYHIIPRYPDDGRWGAPVWLTNLKDMEDMRLPDDEFERLLADIQRQI